jgi:SAM-dependent methyltransferase
MPEVMLINELAKIPAPSVIDLGARRVEDKPSTLRHEWVPHAKEYIGVDFQPGLDVDVVADVHTLSDTLGENKYDAVISCSTLEHIQYPWIAAVEICRVLKPGGFVFIQTHHTFPIHSYPYDYWRFTEDGLRALFNRQIGFEVMGTRSDFRCTIVSEREPDIINQLSYLNVILTARKVSHPPSSYVWTADSALSNDIANQSSVWSYEREYHALQQKLATIERSHSWRLTAPLRALRRWFSF